MTTRSIFILCFIFCLTLLGMAAYLQYVEGLEPCPMCIMQRWALIALALWLLVASIHHPNMFGQKIYATGMMFIAALGAIVAGRQVWLQHLPANAQPECGPGLDYLLNNFPITEAFSYIFSGTGECAVVDWTFLGQSLAVWSACAFIALALVGIFLLFRKHPIA